MITQKYTTLYWAYGANLNLNGMKYRCPKAQPVKTLVLQNYELAFSGVATIRPRQGAHVHGALWLLTKDCEDSLDIFEGYPSLYRKEWIEQNGTYFMAYVMNRDRPQKPSQGYLDTIAEGYREWNLPVSRLLSIANATKDIYKYKSYDYNPRKHQYRQQSNLVDDYTLL